MFLIPQSEICNPKLMKHFTIPIFVPELACPNRCVFCNQHSISGCQNQPEPEEVREIILKHLNTIPTEDSHIEIGFFGGSFTGIEPELQKKYLTVANEFLEPDSRWSRLRSTTENQNSTPSLPKNPSPVVERSRDHLDSEIAFKVSVSAPVPITLTLKHCVCSNVMV